MFKFKRIVHLLTVLLLLFTGFLLLPRRAPGVDGEAGEVRNTERGAYLVHAAGCISCHRDDAGKLSGGLALESPFGTFHVPNITPDIGTGIGGWSLEQLARAIKYGKSPKAANYFPAFPYRAYQSMTDQDALDIAAWLLDQEPVTAAVPDHQLPFPETLGRFAMSGWNRLADWQTPEFSLPADPQLARGAYLARSLGHCGECHTPRNRLGIPRLQREFSGAVLGDSEAPAIDAEALEGWTEGDFAFLLLLGLKPDDEYVGGEMEGVIEHNTSALTDADRQALAAFFIRGQQP